MQLTGKCHCGSLAYRLEWPEHASAVPARRCTCDYCVRFNASWTSHPDAGLSVDVEDAELLGRYRFATATADFLFCARCGVTIAAVCESQGKTRAVVNVNSLDDFHEIEFDRSDSNFDDETREQRLSRRAERWIGRVSINCT